MLGQQSEFPICQRRVGAGTERHFNNYSRNSDIWSDSLRSTANLYLQLGYKVSLDQRYIWIGEDNLGQTELQETLSIRSPSGSTATITSWNSPVNNLRRYELSSPTTAAADQLARSIRPSNYSYQIRSSNNTTYYSQDLFI